MANDAPRLVAYQHHVLICTGGSCAAETHSRSMYSALLRLLAQQLRQGNHLRVICTTVDCLAVCGGGPLLVVYPEGIWYHHVDEALLERIVIEHLVNGRPVEEAIFHRFGA